MAEAIASIFVKWLKSKPAMTRSAKLCTSGPWSQLRGRTQRGAATVRWSESLLDDCTARGRTIQSIDIIEYYWCVYIYIYSLYWGFLLIIFGNPYWGSALHHISRPATSEPLGCRVSQVFTCSIPQPIPEWIALRQMKHGKGRFPKFTWWFIPHTQ